MIRLPSGRTPGRSRASCEQPQRARRTPRAEWRVGLRSGQASWFEFAKAVFSAAGLNPDRVTPTDSATFVRPAPRPSYSVLGHDAWATAGLPPLRSWQEALADAARHGVLERETDDDTQRGGR
nr:sugar nucleotide-binding protein [uncultured Leifsonia sp.]